MAYNLSVQVTARAEPFCHFGVKFKNQRPPAEVAPAPSRGHPHSPSFAGSRWLAAATTANSSFVIRQFFRRAEIGQEVVQKSFHSTMGRRLSGDEAGGISPFAKRFQQFIGAADDMHGNRPGLIFPGYLDIGLMVAQYDYQCVIIYISHDEIANDIEVICNGRYITL